MSGQLVIRTMRISDLPRVLEIEHVSYTMPWTEATFAGLLRRADADMFVALVDNEIAGYAAFWAVVDQGELGNLAVAPPWRHRRIASRLLSRVIERAGERGVRELFLEVRISNSVARQLYTKYGFREVGRRKNYYLEPLEDALVMQRELPADVAKRASFD
jgi:ribosomal-protein-alanine N-acetyltransferase